MLQFFVTCKSVFCPGRQGHPDKQRSRGTMVEYTVPNKAEDTSLDVDIETVMQNCRICLVRNKRVAQGSISYDTSIWSFSDDSTVRLEQKRA